MKLGVDYVEYKNTYFKSNFIKCLIIIAVCIIMLCLFTDSYEPNGLTVILILIIFYSLIKICIIFSPHKNSNMEFKNDSLEYTINYNGMGMNPFIKCKIYRYFNITSISESNSYYYVKGELDLTRIYQTIKKTPKVVHKYGTFKVPKYYGDANIFKTDLYKLIEAKRVGSDTRNYQ